MATGGKSKPPRPRNGQVPGCTLRYADGTPSDGVTARYTDKQVVKAYKKVGRRLRAAGEALGMSHTRVHQIVRRAAPHLLRSQGGGAE